MNIVATQPPDLILLDILMPGMDGYEVCRRLKSNESSRNIPIIFITAKNDPWDEPKGLGLGAVDFLTKPVLPQIVQARIHTHLELKKQQDLLEQYNQQLERRIKERTQELSETINLLSQQIEERKLAEETAVRNARLASLGTLAAGVAHEINNPNNAINFAAATITRLWGDFITHLNEFRQANGDFAVCGLEADEAMQTMSDLVAELGKNSQRIAAIITNLKHMARGDMENLDQDVDVNAALTSAVEILRNTIKKHTDGFSMELMEEPPIIKGNVQQLEQVFINLIQNALESLPRRDGKVTVSTRQAENHNGVCVIVRDEGVGINAEQLDLITKPFFTTKGDSGGTGLGLSIAKTILNNHRCALEFTSTPGEGTVATVCLPMEATHSGKTDNV